MDNQILSFMIKHPEIALSIQRSPIDDGYLMFALRHLITGRTIKKTVPLFEIENIPKEVFLENMLKRLYGELY